MLNKSAEDITIGEIVRTLEETTAITDCSERDEKLCGVCNKAGDCLSRWVWIEASNAMFARLDEITIGGLLSSKPGQVDIEASESRGKGPDKAEG